MSPLIGLTWIKWHKQVSKMIYLSSPESFMCFRITRMSVISAFRRKKEKNHNILFLMYTLFWVSYKLGTCYDIEVVFSDSLFEVSWLLLLLVKLSVWCANSNVNISLQISYLVSLQILYPQLCKKNLWRIAQTLPSTHVFSMTRFRLMVPVPTQKPPNFKVAIEW